MKHTRRVITALTALCLVVSLAACSGGNGNDNAPAVEAQSSAPSETSPAPDEGTGDGGSGDDFGLSSDGETVDFLLTYPREKVVLYELLDRFTEETGHPLNIMYMPLDDAKKQINVMVAAQSLPDVLDIDSIDGAAYAKMGICVDITDRVNAEIPLDQFYDGPIAFSQYDGKFYSLPFTTNNICLVYNKDLFAEAGISAPPETWDELFDYAGRLTTDSVVGYGMSGYKNSDTTFQWFPLMWQAGGSFDDFESAAVIEAMNYYKSFVDAGYMSKEMINWNASDIANNFLAGRMAMVVAGTWTLASMEAAEFDWDVAMLPAGSAGRASTLGGHNLTITSTDNVDASWALLKYFCEPDVMQQFGEAENYLPSRKDVVANSDYFTSGKVGAYTQMAEFAQPRGPLANFPKVDTTLQNALQAVLLDQQTPEEAAAAVAAVIAEND